MLINSIHHYDMVGFKFLILRTFSKVFDKAVCFDEFYTQLKLMHQLKNPV